MYLQIIGAEKLTRSQNELIQRYLALVKPQGVLVGALTGAEAWDVRPVLLLNGQLSVLRFTDPEFVKSQAAWKWLREFHTALSLLAKLPGYIARGEAAGQLWMHRIYYQNVLDVPAAQQAAAASPVRVVAAKTLVELLYSLHRRGLFHGHVCRSNISWEGGVLVLLDYGFMLASRSAARRMGSDTAPEYRSHPGFLEPSAAADVFGLAQILKLLELPESSAYQRELLDSALSVEPEHRPQLAELARSFARESGTKDVFGGPRTMPGSPGVPSGRLIAESAQREAPRKPSAPSRQMSDFAADATVVVPPPARPPLPPEKPGKETAKHAEAPPRRQSEPRDEKPAARADWGGWLLFAAVLSLGAVLAASYLRRNVDEDLPEWEDEWVSGQPSEMQEVASAAIQRGNRHAQTIIVADALKGNARPRVRGDILRFAFNPAWEAELSPVDRKIVLQLALSGLVQVKGDVPVLKAAHPAVVAAIAGNTGFDSGKGALSAVPLSRMSGLPGQGGRAFDELDKIFPGATVDLAAARALSHFLAGDVSEDTIEKYFDGEHEAVVDELTIDKLRVVLLLIATVPALEEPLFEYLYDHGGSVSARLNWFDAGDTGIWEDVPHRLRLLLSVSVLPESGLQFEHYADLLTFPRRAASAQADRSFYKEIYRHVLENFTERRNIAATLKYLVGGTHHFSRTQVVSLLASLRAKGDDEFSLISVWFRSGPDPQDVIGLVLARSDRAPDDPFNGEAASYLSRTANWTPSLDQYQGMIRHPVQLVRALAYARLDPTVPAEADLLLAALAQEPNQSLKSDIQGKLDTARELHGSIPTAHTPTPPPTPKPVPVKPKPEKPKVESKPAEKKTPAKLKLGEFAPAN